MSNVLRSMMGRAGMSFGHLAKITPRGARAEGDDDRDDRNDRDDDSGKGKKGKRADGGDDDDDDDDDDGDRAENDDDDEEEMRGKSASARARRRERARCAAIFGCKAAAKNPVLAANLAFNTSMTRQQAIQVLNDTPAPQATYGSRRNPNLGAGGEQSQSREQAAASSWDRAFAKARGER
ncbi:hypothetical protein [Burkholderia anthina]|uniref:hypothetical protein n=1 Tax=Burkholderia anthina TaxID=179879 RepID=UPI00158F6679|nr:hypothetical protein [Burkholderia anthina]